VHQKKNTTTEASVKILFQPSSVLKCNIDVTYLGEKFKNSNIYVVTFFDVKLKTP